jgi:hypothetical protein
MEKLRTNLRMWREAIPIIVRMVRTGNIDRFEVEARALRARYGIGDK